MSRAADRAGAAAAAALVRRMAALVRADAPDIAAEPVDGGLRLTGPRLSLRMVEDVRLRALAAQAARVQP